MDAPVQNPQDESLGDLFGQLIDDGRAVATAEINLYKQIALHRAGRARSGAVSLVAGGVLLWFAMIALILGLVLGLATLIGPLGAGVVVALVLGIGGYLLVNRGLGGLRALSGDDEERQALSRGESL